MTKPLVIIVPHKLGRHEAISRLQGGMTQLRAQVAGKVATIEDEWTGNQGRFRVAAMGQTITARLDVMDESVRVEVELPWMLAAIADSLRDRIQHTGAKMLEKK